jgi:hypothetical protein
MFSIGGPIAGTAVNAGPSTTNGDMLRLLDVIYSFAVNVERLQKGVNTSIVSRGIWWDKCFEDINKIIIIMYPWFFNG